MAKKFQDIIAPGKRSIRNIPLSNRLDDEPFPSNTPTKARGADSEAKKYKTAPPSPKKIEQLLEIENRSNRGKSIWVIALIFIIFMGFVTVSKFANATINLVVSAKPIALANTFKLSNNSSSTDSVGYDVVTLSVSTAIPESAIIVSTSTPATGKRSTGTITIFNNFSKSSQLLIKETRFETPEGKIFFLDNTVTVPGQATIKGVVTPGTITAKVTAAKPGEEYNVGTKTFTLPGLKTSPKYKFITAKSKTAIGGGEEAIVKPSVDPSVLESIEAELKNRALNQISSQKSDDYVLLPGATQQFLEVDATNTVALTVSALLVNKSDLVGQIDNQKNLDMNLAQISMRDLVVATSGIKVTMPSDIKLSAHKSDESFNIAIEGTTSITDDVTPEYIKKQLAGLNADVAEARLKSKIGVEGVLLEMWPWWVKNIPKDFDKINVNVENN